LSIKANFLFHGGKLKFTGKRDFDRDDSNNIVSDGEYELEGNLSESTSFVFTHRSSGSSECEGDYNLWRSEDGARHLGLYKKTAINEVGDVNTHALLTFNAKHNQLFHFGFRDIAIYRNSNNKALRPPQARTSLSLGALTKLYQNEEWYIWGGLDTAFFLGGSEAFKYARALFGFRKPNFNGYVHLGSDKVSNHWATQVDPQGSPVWHEKITSENTLNLVLEGKINNQLSLFTDLNSKLADKPIDSVAVGALYSVNPKTSVKAKISDDLSVTAAFIHRYRNFVDLSFTAQFNYSGADDEIDSRTLAHIKHKFGVKVEFFDEALL
jgi:hypothetical protein